MKKMYFQYTPEYGRFVKERYAQVFCKFPEMDKMFILLDKMWCASARILSHVISEYDMKYTGLKTILMRQNRPSPVLLRLIRYEPGNIYATTPHADKSAFTLHMNSDESEQDRFIIGRFQPGILKVSELASVSRQDRSQNGSDAIVFPGIFLREMGFQILPSPHAALGTRADWYRHSLVAFWLIPNLFTDHLKTDLAYRESA